MRALLERVLEFAAGAPPSGEPLDLAATLMARLVDWHRVAPLLPLESVRPPSRDVLRTRHRRIAAFQLRLRSTATEVLDTLERAGLPARVLKGLATAELDYPDVHLRQSGDIDLAVAPDDLDDVVAVLTGLGCTHQPTPFDPVLWYGRTLETGTGLEIDLHTRLFRRSPLGLSLVDEPGDALPGLSGTALPAEQRLVHAAGHFMISPPGQRRMNGFLDIGRLLERPDLDLDATRRFARSIGVERLVGAGIRVEAELSERRPVLRSLAEWRQPDRFEQMTRLTAHRRLVLDHLGRYREVPAGHRLEYLPAWLLPTARQRRLLRSSAAAATSRALARTRRGRLVS